MMFGKRAQISLFIIIGLVLVIAAGAGLFYYSSSQSPRTSVTSSTASAQALESSSAALSEMVKSCLEAEAKAAVELYGITDSSNFRINGYIMEHIKGCVDSSYFEDKGLVLELGQPSSEVRITNEAVLVALAYPIKLRFGETATSLEKFEYNLKREKSADLPLGQDGRTTEEVRLLTEDGDAEVIIPAGTKASLSDGTIVDKISFKMVEKGFGGLSNRALIGMVAYEGLPDGVQFEPAITIQIKYKEGELPADIDESQDIALAWYDLERGLWRGVPTTIDTENRIITSAITHFSNIEVAKCPASPVIIATHNYGRVFEQDCGNIGSCTAAEWVGGLHEKETTSAPVIKELNSFSSPTLFSETKCVLKDWDGDDQNSKDCPDGFKCLPSLASADVGKFFASEGDGYTSCTCIAPDGIPDKCDCQRATYKTYGYESPLVGEVMLPFFIAGGGDSCVMSSSYVQDKGGWLADIDVDVTCSPGDSCEVEPVKMTDLRAGWNAVHVKLANLGGDDGCLWADAKITIKGSGIGFGINGSCTDMDGGNSPFAVGGAYGKIGPEVDETWVQDECLSENGLEFARDYTCVNGYIVPSTTLCDGGCDGGIGGGTCRRTAGHSCSPDSPSQNSGCFDGQVCLASKSSRGDCYDIVNPKTGSFKYDYTCDLGEKYSGELDETTCSDKGMAFLKEEFAGKEVNEGTLYDIDENTGVHCNTDIHGIANQYAIIWCSFWVG